ncbi:hypothetical protein [Roseomonas genomospecies 6]|uniref:Uncharacterized protein n=1 Tax=Roseomonas genomospecies 6 TaxID=214106 RepID=A0A9W7NGD5_9PROT|nr:hypothetical protein [Roseomonas genomospecies 6]KAA0677161.1 hypothetical protein DS843_24530 [Roseomonas genomospecies 6]
MAGRKLFTNHSPYGMTVTLIVRASDDPRNQAGTKEFYLGPSQSQWQEYGNHIDIYLNGIRLAAVYNGQMIGQQYVVIIRGSSLDDALNRNNGVDFNVQGLNFSLSTRQVS